MLQQLVPDAAYGTKSITCSPTSHPFIERLIGKRVEDPFEESVLIDCFSGTLKTWSESWPRSNTITTNIELISHWQTILPCSLTIPLKSNVLNLITIPGDHTAMVCFPHRSLPEFRIRQAWVCARCSCSRAAVIYSRALCSLARA